jgi:uncharacterized protein YbjT (DUF2867 family)
MYAITGITGKVGGSVARALLKARLPVRAVVRDEAKGRAWAEHGCDVAVAALDDPAALANAFSGVEGVFAMMPPIFDPTPGFPEATAMIATLREAVAKAAPERVVALSSIGADADRPNLLNQLGLLERSLSELPMPIAFLRPAWFMENAAADIQSARSGGVIRSYLQPLDRPIPMIAAEDVGRTAAALLQEIWKGIRVVELEAAARVTPIAIAAAFAKALGRPVRAEAMPRTRWEEIFRGAGMNNPLPRIQMVDGFNEGWIDFPDQGASARKGEISLEQAIAALIETVGETAQ